MCECWSRVPLASFAPDSDVVGSKNAEEIAESAAAADPDRMDRATKPLEADELTTGDPDDNGFEFVDRKRE